jgi:hypothetical protein
MTLSGQQLMAPLKTLAQLGALFMFVSAQIGHAANTSPNKSRKRAPTKDIAAKIPEKDSQWVLGLAAGLQNAYLPALGFEGAVGYRNLLGSAELGFFQFSQGDFAGKVFSLGISGRWIPYADKQWFVGFGLGTRTVDITTKADVRYTDQSSGSTVVTSIAWRRSVSQMTLNPKIGWVWPLKKKSRDAQSFQDNLKSSSPWRHSLVSLALGLMMPMGSKARIVGDPSSAEGVSDADYQATADGKLKDVTSVTNAVLPSVEFKYFYLLR